MQDTISQAKSSQQASPTQAPAPAKSDLPQHETVSLLLETEPWHRAFYQRLKDALHPPKLPPLQLTSKPAPVKDIWSDYKRSRLATATSVLAHVIVIALLTITFGRQVTEVVKKEITVLYDPSPYDVMLPPAARKAGGGGGGGDRSKQPESKGKLPKLAMEQMAPPAVVIKNPEPKLPVEPTVIVPPNIPLPVDIAHLGDPLGKVTFPSNGPGFGGGIGTGSGGGVGSGTGGGVGPGEGGGVGGGVFHVGGGVSPPQVIYEVKPDYSEQARKAKFQGTVTLSLVVQRDGSVRDIKIVNSLGLGLDEKAIDAVKQWRFRPGERNGQAVDVSAIIEVTFRLL